MRARVHSTTVLSPAGSSGPSLTFITLTTLSSTYSAKRLHRGPPRTLTGPAQHTQYTHVTRSQPKQLLLRSSAHSEASVTDGNRVVQHGYVPDDPPLSGGEHAPGWSSTRSSLRVSSPDGSAMKVTRSLLSTPWSLAHASITAPSFTQYTITSCSHEWQHARVCVCVLRIASIGVQEVCIRVGHASCER